MDIATGWVRPPTWTLIAERHAMATDDTDEGYGAAMVGRDTLVRIIAELGKGSEKMASADAARAS